MFLMLSQFLEILGTGTVVGGSGFMIWKRFRTKKLDYFFKACNLQCDGKFPKILKHKKLMDENKKIYGEEYKILMPIGMCMNDFEKKKEAMEQYKRGKVEIWFDNNLFIKIDRRKVKTMYDFELENCKGILEILAGYDVNGEKVYINVEDAPHILIAGVPGSGKSVLLRSIITSLILTKDPTMLQLNLVDFQRVELGVFKKCQMVKEFVSLPQDFSELLDKLAEESDRRLELFENCGVVNIQNYNKKHQNEKINYVLTIVDEFGALAGENKDIFEKLKKRAAQDRKCGLHLVLCTQRPSTDVIKGTIKANIPARIALKTATDTDSQVILDENGAEKLRGNGHGIIKFRDKQEVQFMFLSEDKACELVKPTFISKPKKQKTDRPGVIGDADGTRQEDDTIY
jgi:S-DNA-T family DNA segregation ATPase FtsK/SpoIIIE